MKRIETKTLARWLGSWAHQRVESVSSRLLQMTRMKTSRLGKCHSLDPTHSPWCSQQVGPTRTSSSCGWASVYLRWPGVYASGCERYLRVEITTLATCHISSRFSPLTAGQREGRGPTLPLLGPTRGQITPEIVGCEARVGETAALDLPMVSTSRKRQQHVVRSAILPAVGGATCHWTSMRTTHHWHYGQPSGNSRGSWVAVACCECRALCGQRPA